MTNGTPWWKPSDKLKDHPEMEKRQGIPPDHVIVRRDEWLKARNRVNITPRSVAGRMALGALIGLFIIASFILSVDDPDPDWGKFWMVRPLIITPLAGAFGILAFYLPYFVRPRSSFATLLLLVLSFLAFLIALWLGSVLGLDGTLWN